MKAEALTKKDCNLFEQTNAAEPDKLNQTWRSQFSQLINSLFTVNNEPTVRQFVDRKGNQIWQVYDPTSDHTVWLNSETEVRIWCDRRFNA